MQNQKININIESWKEIWDRNTVSILIWSRVFGIKSKDCEHYQIQLNSSNANSSSSICSCQRIQTAETTVFRCYSILRGLNRTLIKISIGLSSVSLTKADSIQEADSRCLPEVSSQLVLQLNLDACIGWENLSEDCVQYVAPPILSFVNAPNLNVNEPAILTGDVLHLHASHGRGPLSAGFRRFSSEGGCHMQRPGCLDYLSVVLRSPPLRHSVPERDTDWLSRLGCQGGRCGSCALVGNGWHLLGADLGAEIDAHNIVVRFGAAAPTTDFEADVGSRTSLRVVVHSILPIPAPHNFDLLGNEEAKRELPTRPAFYARISSATGTDP